MVAKVRMSSKYVKNDWTYTIEVSWLVFTTDFRLRSNTRKQWRISLNGYKPIVKSPIRRSAPTAKSHL